MEKIEYIWLSRDKGESYVDAWSSEPTLHGSGEFCTVKNEHRMMVTEYANARRIFGISLRPGQCRRIKIEVTE